MAEARKVHKDVMSIYRAMLSLDRPGCAHVTDNSVIQQLKILSPMSVVVDLRINLFVRAVQTLPVQLLHVSASAAHSPRSWLEAVRLDLNRLAVVSDKLAGYRDASLLSGLP